MKVFVNNTLFFLFFLSFAINAQTVFDLPKIDGSLKFSQEVSVVVDTSFHLTVADLESRKLMPVSEKVIPDLGWGKFRGWVMMKIISKENQHLYFQIHNPVFDESSIYFYLNGKQVSAIGKIKKSTQNRPNSFRLLTVPFFFKKDSLYQIYISGISKFNPAKFPIRILSQTGFNEFRDTENLYNGLLIGFISVLISLNIIIFFFFKVRVFLVFSFSNLSFLLLYLYLEGYLFGHAFSGFLFENSIFNFQYLIYFSFQLFNFVFVWSIYRIYFLEKTRWNLTYSVLLFIGITEGVLMFFSPIWENLVSHKQVIIVGQIIRFEALLSNIFLLIIILKTWSEKSFSKWMLLAILPGWLSYVVPRFAAVFLHDTWVTLPFLYSISSIWNVLFITIGLFLELSRNYKANVEKVSEKELMPEDIPLPLVLITPHLSKRETEILQAFANGFSYQEISDAMFISPHTVRTHLKNIYNKLEINSKAEAIRWVIEHQ